MKIQNGLGPVFFHVGDAGHGVQIPLVVIIDCFVVGLLGLDCPLALLQASRKFRTRNRKVGLIVMESWFCGAMCAGAQLALLTCYRRPWRLKTTSGEEMWQLGA